MQKTYFVNMQKSLFNKNAIEITTYKYIPRCSGGYDLKVLGIPY